jgi:hypothetical protein
VAKPSFLWNNRWLVPEGGANNTILYSEMLGHRLRRVNPATKAVTDFAGNGYSGPPVSDGTPAAQAEFYYPGGVARDAAGITYVADTFHQMIWKIDASGNVTRIAGTGYVAGLIDGEGGDARDDRGDNGPATNATFAFPIALAYSPQSTGYLYVAEDGFYQNHNAQNTDPIFSLGNRIRRINLSTGVITTYAGTGFWTASIDGDPLGGADSRDNLGDNGQATACTFARCLGMCIGPAPNYELYVADAANHRVRRISSLGIINTIAGTGIATGSVDGEGGVAVDDLKDGQAPTNATMNGPAAVWFDVNTPTPRLVIADNGNCRIRRIEAPPLGTMATIAGIATWDSSGNLNNGGYAGDGGPATAAQIQNPWGVVVDASKNVYFADAGNGRIRMINGTTNVITTVAGDAATTYIGVGVPALEANLLSSPYFMSFAQNGDMYVADLGHQIVRKVAGGTITTIAGNGTISWDIDGQGGDTADDVADNVQATSTSLCWPVDAEVDSQGNVYIAEWYSSRVRKVATNGIITSVAGPDSARCVSLAATYFPSPNNRWYNFAFLFSGRLDQDASGGSYSEDNWGNGGPATSATLAFPSDIAIAANGDVYISDGGMTINWNPGGAMDMGGCMVRKVDHTTNVITTVVGTGYCTGSIDGPGGNASDDLNDGRLATTASLRFNRGITFDPAGNLYISDTGNSRVRMVDAVNWNINTVVGTGYSTGSIDGYSSGDPLDDLYDVGPGTSVSLSGVWGIDSDPNGNIYFADTGSNRVRKLAGGYVSTIAGDGTDLFWDGFYGDGRPSSTGSLLAGPNGVAYNHGNGKICFTDAGNGRVRCATEVPGGANLKKGPNVQSLPVVVPSAAFPWDDTDLITAAPSPLFYQSDADGTLKLVKTTDRLHVRIYCQ